MLYLNGTLPARGYQTVSFNKGLTEQTSFSYCEYCLPGKRTQSELQMPRSSITISQFPINSSSLYEPTRVNTHKRSLFLMQGHTRSHQEKKTHIFAKHLPTYAHKKHCKHTLIYPHLSHTQSYRHCHTHNIRQFIYGFLSVCSEQEHMYSPEGLDLTLACSLSSSAQLHKKTPVLFHAPQPMFQCYVPSLAIT